MDFLLTIIGFGSVVTFIILKSLSKPKGFDPNTFKPTNVVMDTEKENVDLDRLGNKDNIIDGYWDPTSPYYPIFHDAFKD
jgi:hypothetical protein